MSSLSSWILAACLLAQADPASVTPAEKAAIENAVRQLGSTKFTVREAATKFLWQQGRASEAALRQAAESPDREVRTRAQKILDDFDYDILPTTPAGDVAMLREYRGADLQKRQVIIVEMTNHGRFETVGQLLHREPSFAVRRLLLISLLANEATAVKIITAGQIEKLVERIGADQEEGVRDALLVELYLSPISFKRMLATKSAGTFLGLIKRQKTPLLRDLMFERLVANGAALTLMSEQDSLATLLEFVQVVEDQQRKVDCLALILTNHAGADWIFTTPYATAVLKFAHEKLNAELRIDFFLKIFQHDQFMHSWVEKVELGTLIKAVVTGLRGEERALVLSRLLFCNVVAKQLEETQKHLFWVTVVQEQTDAVARRTFLKQIVHASNFGEGLSHAEESRDKLWEFVHAEKDVDWQVATLATMVRRNFVRIGRPGEPQEFAWLWGLVRGEPTADRLTLQDWVFREPAFLDRAINEGHFVDAVDLAKGQIGGRQGALLGIMVSHPKGVEYLRKNERLDWVFTLMQASWSPEARNHYLLAVVSSDQLVTALLEANKDEALSAAVMDLKDKKARAQIWLALIRRSPMLHRIAEKGEWNKLLAIAKDEPDAAICQEYLSRLFADGMIKKTLLEFEQFEMIFDLLDQCPTKELQLELFGRLIASRAEATALLKQDRGKKLMQLVREADDNGKSRANNR